MGMKLNNTYLIIMVTGMLGTRTKLSVSNTNFGIKEFTQLSKCQSRYCLKIVFCSVCICICIHRKTTIWIQKEHGLSSKTDDLFITKNASLTCTITVIKFKRIKILRYTVNYDKKGKAKPHNKRALNRHIPLIGSVYLYLEITVCKFNMDTCTNAEPEHTVLVPPVLFFTVQALVV